MFGKKEPCCTVGRNVNWYSHYGEQYGGFSKSKTELPKKKDTNELIYKIEIDPQT